MAENLLDELLEFIEVRENGNIIIFSNLRGCQSLNGPPKFHSLPIPWVDWLCVQCVLWPRPYQFCPSCTPWWRWIHRIVDCFTTNGRQIGDSICFRFFKTVFLNILFYCPVVEAIGLSGAVDAARCAGLAQNMHLPAQWEWRFCTFQERPFGGVKPWLLCALPFGIGGTMQTGFGAVLTNKELTPFF